MADTGKYARDIYQAAASNNWQAASAKLPALRHAAAKANSNAGSPSPESGRLQSRLESFAATSSSKTAAGRCRWPTRYRSRSAVLFISAARWLRGAVRPRRRSRLLLQDENRLRHASGHQFDALFLKYTGKAAGEAAALLQHEAQYGHTESLKQYASRESPKAQQNEKEIHNVAAGLGSEGK